MRRVFLSVLLLVFVAAVGLGQSNTRQQLQQLLLTQEELQEVLSGEWEAKGAIDRMKPEPPGALATAVVTFINTTTEIELVDGLLIFNTPEIAGRFIEIILSAPQIEEVRDLKAEAEENQDLSQTIPEKLLKEIDQLLLLSLDNGLQQLILQRQTLIAFLRTSREGQGVLDEVQLFQVADRQLNKILEFCENFEGESRPTYC